MEAFTDLLADHEVIVVYLTFVFVVGVVDYCFFVVVVVIIDVFTLECPTTFLTSFHFFSKKKKLFHRMLVGTGGNSGGQSAALVLQGLASGDIQTSDLPALLIKEGSTAIVLAFCIGFVGFVFLLFFCFFCFSFSLSLFQIC